MVYVLDDTELYGHGIAVVFTEQAKKLGIEVKNADGVPEGMQTGEIVLEDTPAALQANEMVRQAYLGEVQVWRPGQ